MKQKRVLIFPSGTEIGLEINNALKFDKHFKIIGASTVPNHSEYVFRNYLEGLGTIKHENFLVDLNKLIRENEVDFVFPASDDVACFLAENHEKVEAEIIGSDSYTNGICRSKAKTYEFFKEQTFIPDYTTNKRFVKQFPVFAKPSVGAGSVGAKLIKTETDLAIFQPDEAYVYCEFLPGKEYTIDCFTNSNGEILFTGTRERKRIRNGISVNSYTIDTSLAIQKIAQIINKELSFRGAWFFQLKEDVNGELKLLEIATRIAGTMCLYRGKGINLPQLSLNDKLGMDVKILENNFKCEVDRALSNKFKLDLMYQTVCIDFDDTITLDNEVNPLVMYFLYQCVNNNIKIVLITRHEKDLKETLQKYKISTKLFDEIHVINRDTKKSSIVSTYTDPIFIDDSFNERLDVSIVCHCGTFDVNSVEALIDWK